jgi:transcriptional regulator with XRE-family HTH domain
VREGGATGRSDKPDDAPDPIDVYVGSRIRMRRTALGLSQERLADALGLTFQQVQKYERASNRVSASRLKRIADVLNTSVGWLFNEGGDDPVSIGHAQGFAEMQEEFGGAEEHNPREALDLVRAFYRMPAAQRKSVLAFMKSLGQAEPP